MNRIYIGGTPDTNKNECIQRFTAIGLTLELMGFNVFSPLDVIPVSRTDIRLPAEYDSIPVSSNHDIINCDKWLEHSDFMLMNFLDSPRVSLGSAIELGWAMYNGVHVVVAMGNADIHNHAFIREAADVIFSTMQEAYDYLETMIENNKKGDE